MLIMKELPILSLDAIDTDRRTSSFFCLRKEQHCYSRLNNYIKIILLWVILFAVTALSPWRIYKLLWNWPSRQIVHVAVILFSAKTRPKNIFFSKQAVCFESFSSRNSRDLMTNLKYQVKPKLFLISAYQTFILIFPVTLFLACKHFYSKWESVRKKNCAESWKSCSTTAILSAFALVDISS